MREKQRQREQQQMAKVLASGRPKKEAIVTMRSAGEDMTPEEHQHEAMRPTRCSRT